MVREITNVISLWSSALFYLKDLRKIMHCIIIAQLFELYQSATTAQHKSYLFLLTLTLQGIVTADLKRSISWLRSTYPIHPTKIFSNSKCFLKMWVLSHGCTMVIMNGWNTEAQCHTEASESIHAHPFNCMNCILFRGQPPTVRITQH